MVLFVSWSRTSRSCRARKPPSPTGARRPAPPRPVDANARREYQTAERVGTKKAWEDFLAKHPSGQYSDLARDRLAKLDSTPARPRPDPDADARRACQSAERIGTKKAWEDFIDKHPTGSYSDLARDRLAKLEPAPKPDVRLDDPAIQDLDKRIQSNPNDVAAYHKRGQLYAQHGDFQRAIKDFDQTLRLNPKDAEALSNRCWARAVVGKLQATLKDCGDALQIRPRYLDAFDGRGFVGLKLGQWAGHRGLRCALGSIRGMRRPCTDVASPSCAAAVPPEADDSASSGKAIRPTTLSRNSRAMAYAQHAELVRRERSNARNPGSMKKLACLALATPDWRYPRASVSLAQQQPSAEQIIKALKPQRLTRGLTTSPADATRADDETRFIDTLRNRTYSLTANERDKIVSIAKDKPSIDLEITFDYNSATIGSKALPQVQALGEALTSADLKDHLHPRRSLRRQGGRHLQSGPVGAARRCDEAVPLGEVRDQAGDAVSVGYGKSHLKNTSTRWRENRRVQVVNTADR